MMEAGNGVEKFAGVVLLGIFEQGLCAVLFHNPSFMHDGHGICCFTYQREIVGDQQDSHVEFFVRSLISSRIWA